MNHSTNYRAVLAATVALAAMVFALMPPPGAAQTQVAPTDIATSQDCLEYILQAADDPALTREERIARLDKILLESLSHTDLCRAAGVGAAGAGGETGGGAAGAGGGVAGRQGGDGAAGAADSAESANAGNAGAPVESLPVSDIQGDAPADAADPADPANAAPAETAAAAPADADDAAGQPANVPGAGGDAADSKLPDDIPPAANDDIIARQLRQAAQDETDPQTRAKLWNEYRRYKNLPVKAVPESTASTESDTQPKQARQ